MKVYIYTLLTVASVLAQSCENYGTQNGSSCSCPTGFGGPTCSQPACGGDIFQGSQRPLAPPITNSSANLTAAGCSCENGWTGTGCNVCQTASSCQAAFGSSGNAPSDAESASGVDNGLNNTLVCNTAPRVWAASHMSCQVNVCIIALSVLSAKKADRHPLMYRTLLCKRSTRWPRPSTSYVHYSPRLLPSQTRQLSARTVRFMRSSFTPALNSSTVRQTRALRRLEPQETAVQTGTVRT